jgi:gas vesicle protein
MKRSNGSGMTMTGLALGFLLGAATALLVAPNSGKENRDLLSNRINNIKGRVRRSQDTEDMDVEGMVSQVNRADYLH